MKVIKLFGWTIILTILRFLFLLVEELHILPLYIRHLMRWPLCRYFVFILHRNERIMFRFPSGFDMVSDSDGFLKIVVYYVLWESIDIY